MVAPPGKMNICSYGCFLHSYNCNCSIKGEFELVGLHESPVAIIAQYRAVRAVTTHLNVIRKFAGKIIEKELHS